MRSLILAALVLGGALLIRQPAAAQTSDPSGVLARVDYWAAAYGYPVALAEGIVLCEDRTLDPSLVGAAGEISVEQWLPATYAHYRALMGDPAISADPWDLESNIRLAVWTQATGHASEWSCAA